MNEHEALASAFAPKCYMFGVEVRLKDGAIHHRSKIIKVSKAAAPEDVLADELKALKVEFGDSTGIIVRIFNNVW